MIYDLVIRDGTVVDGSGLPPYRADVGVVGDRIAHIGRIDQHGIAEIDAEGHMVSPGFIDIHTHMDAQLFWDSLGSCSCWHGVTSVVMGNCGFTLAPAHAREPGLVLANLERAEDIPASALAAGVDWTWSSFSEYLDAVDREPKAINYAAQIGHSALRTFAMGTRAFSEDASEDDMAHMARTLGAALHDGAVGFTTSLSETHLTMDDRPVASRRASWGEISQLVAVLGEVGAGIFEIAPDKAMWSEDPQAAAQAYGVLRDLAVSTRVPLTFGIAERHVPAQLDLLDETAAGGGRMIGQVRSGPLPLVHSFKAGMPFDRLDVWKEVRAAPFAEQQRCLRDPAIRAQLVDVVQHAYATGASTGLIGGRASLPSLDTLQVMREGETTIGVNAPARLRCVNPIELMMDLAVETDLEQVFVRFFGWKDADLIPAMQHPRTVISFSDQGAHVGYYSGADLHTTLLSEWVRDRQLFTLEEAVRQLTLVPALTWNLGDRGLVREGMIADLNVFDLDSLANRVPTVERELPGGAARITQKATGYLATVVAGTQTFQSGTHTGEHPGRLIRGRLASDTSKART